MIFFTSDTHFNHLNIIKSNNRPFSSIEEMNSVLIDNWNNKIKSNDTVYHLGDFIWKNPPKIIHNLNGNIILIKGNHDKSTVNYIKNNHISIPIYDMLDIKLYGIQITLCHFCLRVWNKSHFNSWHLFGHSHGCLPPLGKSWDVGVDNNNYSPLSVDEIFEILKKRPDNCNWLKALPGYTLEDYEKAKKEEMKDL